MDAKKDRTSPVFRCIGKSLPVRNIRCLKKTRRKPDVLSLQISKEKIGFSAQGIEIDACITQGDTWEELEFNMREALDLCLDEPEDSKRICPDPDPTLKGRNIVAVPVDPQIAFAMQVRQSRLKNKWTQKEAAKALGMKNIFSYQRLESSKTANPELSTLMRLCAVFPGFSVDRILDVGAPAKA